MFDSVKENERLSTKETGRLEVKSSCAEVCLKSRKRILLHGIATSLTVEQQLLALARMWRVWPYLRCRCVCREGNGVNVKLPCHLDCLHLKIIQLCTSASTSEGLGAQEAVQPRPPHPRLYEQRLLLPLDVQKPCRSRVMSVLARDPRDVLTES